MKALMSIGNPLKSDDDIGNIVLDKINLDLKKIKAETTPENFLNELKEFEKIIILDALEFGGEVGEVRVFNLEDLDGTFSSTHSIPISLIKKLLPDSEIKVIGIQPRKIAFGVMSIELRNKINRIGREVENIVRSF